MSIKTLADGKPHEQRENFVCWNKDAQAQALRVEADGRTFVFPFTHIVFVVLESSPKAEEMRVSLTTHDVRIQGRNLRDLTLAFQKFSVDWITAVPARFAPLADPDAVLIEKIEVTELQSDLTTGDESPETQDRLAITGAADI